MLQKRIDIDAASYSTVQYTESLVDYVLFGVKRVSPRAGGGIDCMGLKSKHRTNVFKNLFI